MAHIHEKIDFTVEVFIVCRGKVLLRFHDKYKIWLSVGGHVELDEDPIHAALREVREEVGLDVELAGNLERSEPDTADFKELIPPRFMNRHRISPTHEHITLTYFASSKTDEVKVGDVDDKSNEWKWVSLEELKSMQLKPHVRHYAERALQELS
ncbi:MAG: NUDIX domain-containing protein [Patescibacteria group bacterium]|nr:NUDIX domain-containing protein [Patescibacteria group bacterium]